MKRRDLLKGATLLAAANAAPAFPASVLANSVPAAGNAPLPKIALEEHFMVPEFVEYFAETYINISPDIAKMGLNILPDFGERRLATMDRNRVAFSVLSLAGPGVQAEKDSAVASKRAKWVNDFLAKEIQKKPDHYGGFAHLAMHNPADAANELERCVRDLGFQGALINGQTNGEYLDLDKYCVFWERRFPSISTPATRSITRRCTRATRNSGGRCAAGLSRRPRTPSGWCSPACLNAIRKRG